jgi:hypothetical protein
MANHFSTIAQAGNTVSRNHIPKAEGVPEWDCLKGAKL